jgi:hypothetical protein
MTPRARISGLEIVEQEGGLLIRDLATRTEHVLHPLTAFVWTHADGLTDVDGLAARATGALNAPITTDQVWAAIDVLTGARLLEDRIAPPAGVQRYARRDLLRTVAVGSAAAAAIGVATMPAAAQSNRASQESASKVAQEAAQKKAQEEKGKAADIKARQEDQKKAQESAEKAQHQAREDAQKAEHRAQENANKSQEQDIKSQHEAQNKSQHEAEGKQQSEQRGKNQNPFTDVVLEADWANVGDEFAPLAWERRGAHVHLVGMIEFAGTPEFATPREFIPCVEPDPNADPDSDELDMETMLIGQLPEGARPAATLAFSVASDAILGASEVLITGDGDILLVLDDETDDQLDAALGLLVPAIDPNAETKSSPEPQARACARRLLRRRRRLLRAQRQRQRRLLRKRAQQARRRCIDGQEVLLTGPSEISFSGISFRAK